MMCGFQKQRFSTSFFFGTALPSTARIDALNITHRLAGEVKPLSRMVLSAAECAAFRSLVTLMIMVLSEAPRERFTDALNIAQGIMRKLKLKKLEGIASFLLNSVLLNYFLSILDALPNPVQLERSSGIARTTNRSWRPLKRSCDCWIRLRFGADARDAEATVKNRQWLCGSDADLCHFHQLRARCLSRGED